MYEGYSLCLNRWALDKDLSRDLNLLLIISSLCAENGYCYASNKYLAEIFDINEVSVSRKIKRLERKKYITIEYEKRGNEVISRIIRLTEMLTDDYQKGKPTVNRTVKENIISNNINNKLNEFNLYNNFNENKRCEDITKTGTRCQRKSSFNINGKNYCNQHARDLIPDLEIKNERFKKPTLEEVQAYCSERNNNINAEKFINYYESKGWKIGNSPMKNWKACIRTWEIRNKQDNKTEKDVPSWFDKDLGKGGFIDDDEGF